MDPSGGLPDVRPHVEVAASCLRPHPARPAGTWVDRVAAHSRGPVAVRRAGMCGSVLRRPLAGGRGVPRAPLVSAECRGLVDRVRARRTGRRRLTTRIGLPVSNDTLLRWLKKCAQPATAEPRVIGIDEWATRKGRTYGTIVVDLERHTVIDVLDQHSTEAVEQWLVAHPDIQMICRDRNGRYAKAARTAAPAARQVTDRFHLVQNLRETIERKLALHRAYLRGRVTKNGLPDDPPPVPLIDLPVCPLVARERRLQPARRLATQTEIGRQLRQTLSFAKKNRLLFWAATTMVGAEVATVSWSAAGGPSACTRRRRIAPYRRFGRA
jgi:transposase